MRTVFMVVLAMISICVPGLAKAVIWEELWAARTGTVAAKVDLDKYSFRKSMAYGEKLVSARLRSYYEEGETHSQAVADYEINCVTRAAHRSNLEMSVENPDGSTHSATKPQRESLEGKERQDFLGMMDILCQRE